MTIIWMLTHWGRVTHICVVKLTIIGSDNGLSPGRRQAIIWTNDGILLIWPLGTNFIEILIEIHSFPFKKMHLKMSAKWRPFCLGLNVLTCTSKRFSVLRPGLGSSTFRSTWVKYKYFFIFASTSTSSSTQSTWKTSSTSNTFSIKYKPSTCTLVTKDFSLHRWWIMLLITEYHITWELF